jgi:hypothetical protein
MINFLVRWLVFLHILAAITFFLVHGTSAAMAFQVRKERDFSRIRFPPNSLAAPRRSPSS